MQKKRKYKLTIWQILAIGYFAFIMFGSVLLILPFATKDGQHTSYLNALFTSASAISITGLAPYDTGTHWTLYGQLVILTLVQLGGLGFMTFVSVVFQVFHKGMGLQTRTTVMASFTSSGTSPLNGASTLVKRIIIGTVICEFLGAALLAIRFIPQFGVGHGIYRSFWHSICGFCHAGFDIFGSAEGGAFVSLIPYATDPLVILTLSFLIIMGGLGFCVWGDVIDCRLNWRKFQLNTKVVLVVNAILIVTGTALFLLFERNNPYYADYNFGEKLLCAFFNAITPRTAGFATIPTAKLSESGYVLTIIFMFIGGSSASTAGGIKVGTFAVIIMGMVAAFRGKRDINIGKRRIENSLVTQSLAIFTACLLIIFVCTITICTIEPKFTFEKVLFEVVSALTTTGMSLGITPYLSPASRIILIVLMYAGRVGILTLALALAQKRSAAEIRKPVDTTLLIG